MLREKWGDTSTRDQRWVVACHFLHILDPLVNPVISKMKCLIFVPVVPYFIFVIYIQTSIRSDQILRSINNPMFNKDSIINVSRFPWWVLLVLFCHGTQQTKIQVQISWAGQYNLWQINIFMDNNIFSCLSIYRNFRTMLLNKNFGQNGPKCPKLAQSA